MLDSIFNQTTANISIELVLIATLVSLVLGIAIAIAHKLTSTYNKNFLVTLSLLPLLVQAVIILVNGNLGMGLVVAGTFSLVRFRSVAGTSKEILSVFFAMTIGLATGMGYIFYALLLAIVGIVIILVLSYIPLYDPNKYEKSLRITIPEDLDYPNVFDEVLKKYTKKYELISAKTTALGSMFELKYFVVLKKTSDEKKFLDELRIKNGNLKIILAQRTETSEL